MLYWPCHFLFCILNFMCWSHYPMFVFLIKIHSHLRTKTCDMFTKNQNICCFSWPEEVPTPQRHNTKRATERSDIFLKARGFTFYRSIALHTVACFWVWGYQINWDLTVVLRSKTMVLILNLLEDEYLIPASKRNIAKKHKVSLCYWNFNPDFLCLSTSRWICTRTTH